jgi:type VI secretion system secreted protein VgrG
MSPMLARMIELNSPLGKDLLFKGLRGHEELGRSSEFELTAVSSRADINPSDLLGKSVTVKLELLKGGPRYFNGYVTRFTQGGMVGRQYEYRMIVRSWLWFLTRTTDCRIFQDKNVPDIIKDVFADHPVASFENALNATYLPRTYCVQYRETDFDFVSRLMEEEGIYYYFEHSDGKHTLKMVDSDSGHKTLENKATITFHLPGPGKHTEDEHITALTKKVGIQPGTVALYSFDFEKPKADLGVKSRLLQQHERADYEVFDWAGDYLQTDHGDHYVRVRVDELHSDFERLDAHCNVRDIVVGRLFTLKNAPRPKQDGEYLIVSADYDLKNNTYESGEGEEATYECSMSLLQSRQQFRPARTTPRPTMGGPQTAVVVGPAGDEIHTDKHGRVKVQFHWDRYGKRDENSSCWIRVSQPWAGKDWGTVSIPRIGQEVIVDFLEGDPDQPIIIGRVYNGDNMAPYVLPGAAVISGIKTKTHKGAGYNEISADDTAGKEKITIHGQYDMGTTVEHDQTDTIKNDRKITVDGTHTETIKKDTTISVTQGKEVVTVNKDIDITSQTGHLYITASTEIKLTVGSSTLHMYSDGRIELNGANIAVNGTSKVRTHGGEVTSEADSQHQTIGAIVVSNGSASNTVKGGMVMLNP